MGDSKASLGLIIIAAAVFVVAAGILIWVHNKTDSLTNSFETINNSPQVHVCTDAEKQAEICTMEYSPVCGNDNITYGNKCTACAAKIISWIQGECK